MGFISNKERAKTSRKLYHGYGVKKFIILITLIIGILFAAIILIGVAGQMKWIPAENIAFVIIVDDASQLTSYGIAAIVLTSIEIVFGLISFILLLTIKSPKNVTKSVIKLTSSAIPGRRSGKGASKAARERF